MPSKNLVRCIAVCSTLATVIGLFMAMSGGQAWAAYTRWGAVDHNAWLAKGVTIEDTITLSDYDASRKVDAVWVLHGYSCGGTPKVALSIDGYVVSETTVTGAGEIYQEVPFYVQPGSTHRVGIRLLDQNVTSRCAQNVYIHRMGFAERPDTYAAGSGPAYTAPTGSNSTSAVQVNTSPNASTASKGPKGSTGTTGTTGSTGPTGGKGGKR